jgi:hypothetical protein
MRRPRATNDFWQSYGDLAMGLMAVFVFILILLLQREAQKSVALAEQTARAMAAEKEAKDAEVKLEKERETFATDLLKLLDDTWAIVERQDAAEGWLSAVLKEGGCQLDLGADGTLRISGRADVDAALYVTGDTTLSESGKAALGSCSKSFRLLANCLNPNEAQSVSDARACRRILDGVAEGRERERVAQFRDGIEALVLEGTTDRSSTLGGTGASGRRTGPEEARNYAENARLGSERARQAMIYLLGLVKDRNADDYDALPVLMNRLRVETSSFGRFLAGPPEWREPVCEGDADACDRARRLSLRVRWKKGELRKPYEEVRKNICRRLSEPNDPFRKGLVTANTDLQQARAKYRCDEVTPPTPSDDVQPGP